MKHIVSFLITIGLTAAAFVGLHYLILSFKFSDAMALILFAMPVVAIIAYSTHETPREILRSAISIYTCFISIILAASGIVWFIG
jgi:hypothetical protein